MKIINRVLLIFSGAAVLLSTAFAISAQVAVPTPSPKPSPGSFAAAFDDYDYFAGIDRDQAKIYYRRGANCDAKKDYSCAVENYSRSITADPTRTQVVFLRAVAEMNLSRDTEAIADLINVVHIEAQNDAAYSKLGILYETTGRYDNAMACYRLAIRAAPKKAENYEWLAQRIDANFKKFADKNEAVPPAIDLNEALNALNASLKIEPDDPVNFTAYQERAVVYRNLARAGKPVNGAAEADEKKANDQLAIFTKQVLDKTEAAVAVKEKALAFERSLSPYFTARDFASVVKLTTDAVSQDPTKFRPYNDRAKAYIGLYKYREAIADATKAVEISPTFADGYSNRGLAKMRSGDFAGAIVDDDRAVEIDPTNYATIAQRGSIYMFQGNYELAEIDMLRVLDLHPNDQGARSDMQILAGLRASGYNTGKVKDDALIKFVGINSLILDYNDSVNDRFDLYDKATKEQPRDQAKVCRLLTDTDVSIMVIESFADKMKELLNGGRLDKLPNQKQLATATIGTIANYRTNINNEFTSQGCKK